jgi:hypothetical protein
MFNRDLEKPPSKICEIVQKASFDDSICRTETVEWYSQDKPEKLQLKVWKFQVIHCDDGAGK